MSMIEFVTADGTRTSLHAHELRSVSEINAIQSRIAYPGEYVFVNESYDQVLAKIKAAEESRWMPITGDKTTGKTPMEVNAEAVAASVT